MNIIAKRNLFFILSILIILPGLFSIVRWGFKLSIDFTGGSLLELQIAQPKETHSSEKIEQLVEQQGTEVSTIQESGENTYLLRMKPIEDSKARSIEAELEKSVSSDITITRFETVGPTIGKELSQKAILAVVVSTLLIVIYIAWAFRTVPKSVSSWQFGLTAIVALIHDVLVVLGLFSLLGHFYNVEVDTLFITALLTIMGFSVHDTIVVFDRVRENLKTMGSADFAHVVNESLLQTLARSLSTSTTVMFTLFALYLFSTGSLRWFVVALLAGMVSGTFSSLFTAAPFLVLWQDWREKRKKN